MNNTDKETMRLAKRMAMLGLCSRREADQYILNGWVKVNGEHILKKGHPVKATDQIELQHEAKEAQASKVTILFNKPVGYVSGQAEDGYTPAVHLINETTHWEGDSSKISFDPEHKKGLAPAGRLDIDSNGLLVLTQNGVVAKRLIGAESKIEKEYLVRVSGHLTEEGLQLLNHGLELDGVPLRPAVVKWQNADQLNFRLKQGKKRQIRRMCTLVGLRVTGLKRVRIGQVHLNDLPVGQWRYLSANEQF